MDGNQGPETVPADPAPATAVTVAELARILAFLPAPDSAAALIDRDPGPGGPEIRLSRPRNRPGSPWPSTCSSAANKPGSGSGREARRRDRRADRPGPARSRRGAAGSAPANALSPRCRTRSPPCGPGSSTNGAPPCSYAIRVPDRRGPGRRRRRTRRRRRHARRAGDRPLVAAARTAAHRLAPRSVTDRAAHAATERYVSLRPAPTPCAI